jgi:hypothetical protein
MSIFSLADFNGDVPRVWRQGLLGADTVAPGGHPPADHINAGTSLAIRGDSHMATDTE